MKISPNKDSNSISGDIMNYIASKSNISWKPKKGENAKASTNGFTKPKIDRSRKNNQTTLYFDHHSFTPKINKVSKSMERKVEDLYKWKDKVDKKHDVKRDFNQHIKDSQHNTKSYVNPQSKEMIENKRPNKKVEDILLMKGSESKTKLHQLEQEIYGHDQVPQITNKAHLLHRDKPVYSRLYDDPKLKDQREKSKEKLQKGHVRNNSRDKNTKQPGGRNSAEPIPSSVPFVHKNLSIDLKLTFKPINFQSHSATNQIHNKITRDPSSPNINSSLVSLSSPVQSNRNNALSPKTASFSSLIFNKRNEMMDKSRDSPLDKKQPTNESIEKDKSRISETEELKKPEIYISKEEDAKEHIEKLIASREYESPKTFQERKQSMNIYKHFTRFNREEPKPQNAVLPNMLYFKNSMDRKASRDNLSTGNRSLSRDKILTYAGSKQDEHQDMRVMEHFWNQILKDDYDLDHKKKGETESNKKNDIVGRSRAWTEKKNQNLSQKKLLQDKNDAYELTSKPQFSTQIKNEHSKRTESMSQNVVDRVTSNNIHHKQMSQPELLTSPSRSGLNTSIISNRTTTPGQTKKNNYFISPEATKSIDSALQTKLYNYILNNNKK